MTDIEFEVGSDIEPGSYEGELTDIEVVEGVESQFHDAPIDMVRWRFWVDDPDGDNGWEVSKMTTISKSPRSKMAEILTALLGQTAAREGKHGRQALLGRRCILSVSRTDDGFSRIDAFTEIPKAKAAK